MTASQAYRRAAAAGGKSHPGLASCEAADVQRARSGRPELLPGLVDVGFWVHVHRGDAGELPRLEGGRPGPQPRSPAERARVNITRAIRGALHPGYQRGRTDAMPCPASGRMAEAAPLGGVLLSR